MLNVVYGNNTLKKTTMSKWIKCFNEGYDDFKDKVRSRFLSTSYNENNIELVQSRMLFERRMRNDR